MAEDTLLLSELLDEDIRLAFPRIVSEIYNMHCSWVWHDLSVVYNQQR